MEFKNGSTIKSLEDNDIARGRRSQIIGCECYDMHNDEIVFVVDYNASKANGRYVPLMCLDNDLVDKIVSNMQNKE